MTSLMTITSSSGPTPVETAVGWGFLIGMLALAYFLPTLVALALRRGAWIPTLILNVLLGWTIFGWFLIWPLALSDRRPAVLNVLIAPPLYPPPAPPAPLLVAPDRRHWWNGLVWVDGAVTRPVWAILSPDGQRWWSGTDWLPADASPGLPTPVGGGEETPWWERLHQEPRPEGLG